jgi:hypothetical protein
LRTIHQFAKAFIWLIHKATLPFWEPIPPFFISFPTLFFYAFENPFLVRKQSFYSTRFVTSCLDWTIAGNTVTDYMKTTEKYQSCSHHSEIKKNCVGNGVATQTL